MTNRQELSAPPYITQLTKLLNRNSLALIMGAGEEGDGDFIASHGHRVLSLEKDPEVAKRGQARHAALGDASIRNAFLIADMQDDLFEEHSFDAVIAANSLQDILPLSESRVAISRIMSLTRPGGFNLIKAYIGDEELRQLKSDKYSIYGPHQIQAKYQTAGWELVSVDLTPPPYALSPDGRITSSVGVIARKPA